MPDNFIDMTARRPSGWLGKRMYSNPRGHYRAFRLTLDKLALKQDDTLLEIGCGGGVLLDMALKTVKHAKAIDHSPDMVQIARDRNREALSEGRVEIVSGNAESLPWDDDLFTWRRCCRDVLLHRRSRNRSIGVSPGFKARWTSGHHIDSGFLSCQDCCFCHGLVPCTSTVTGRWNRCLKRRDSILRW